MIFSLKRGTGVFFEIWHVPTYMLMLRVVSIRIHFLIVDTEYSESFFIINTFKSSHKSGDIKANSSFVLFNSQQRFYKWADQKTD